MSISSQKLSLFCSYLLFFSAEDLLRSIVGKRPAVEEVHDDDQQAKKHKTQVAEST